MDKFLTIARFVLPLLMEGIRFLADYKAGKTGPSPDAAPDSQSGQ